MDIHDRIGKKLTAVSMQDQEAAQKQIQAASNIAIPNAK